MALLLVRQTEGLGHFRIGQGAGAALLERDLFQSLELIFFQYLGQ
ncbi:MAG TPA: hypothetical protein VHV08_06870 [Pirellulales bacterium]|nr:hypothetical protein [Pirellulales bacterium]